MGLGPFSGKTVVSADIATVPLHDGIPADRLTNTIINAISDGDDIASSILFNTLTGYKSNLLNFYRYGRDSYDDGLPVTNLSNNQFNIAAVDTQLTTIEGTAVTIDASFLYIPTVEVWGKWWLFENEANYDYTANTLLISSTTWDVVGFTYDSVVEEITVLLQDGANTSTYGPIASALPTVEYYIVEYHTDAAPAVSLLWLYNPALGTYPSLNITSVPDTSGILPIVPIRVDDVNVNANTNSELYRDTRALLQRMKIDLDSFTTGVTKQTNGAGELVDIDDLAQISDIFILYGLSVYGSTREEKLGLFNLFDGLRLMARVNKATYDAAAGGEDIPQNSYLIDTSNFNYELVFSYITTTTVAGKVTDRNDYTVSHTILPNTFTPIDSNRIVESYITLRHQFSESEYEELVVKGVYLNHTIKTILGERLAEVFLEAYTEGQDLTDNQKNFIIPLTQRDILLLSNREGDVLIPLSAHALIYASDSQYVKWYRTAFFNKLLGLVLRIVAIVLLLKDWTGDTSKLFLKVAEALIYQFAFEFVLKKLLIRYADNDAVQALILVASVVAATKFSTSKFSELQSAEKFIAVTNAVAGSTQIYASVEKQLLDEAKTIFADSTAEIEDQIEAAQDFLEVRSDLDLLSNSYELPYEEPRDFFARTLNTAPGQQVFEQLHSYVDNNLNLDYI